MRTIWRKCPESWCTILKRRVLTLGLHDNYQDRQIVDQVLAPLRELKLLEPTMQRQFGTDHASFDDVGVPGFWVVQDGAEYTKTHHSQSDTFR